LNPAEQNWRLAYEVAGRLAAELNADADEAATRRIAEIIAPALAAAWADARADEPAIAAERQRADQAIAATLAQTATFRQTIRDYLAALDMPPGHDRIEAIEARTHWLRNAAAMPGDYVAAQALLAELAAGRALRAAVTSGDPEAVLRAIARYDEVTKGAAGESHG
jgi:hypothetical protein